MQNGQKAVYPAVNNKLTIMKVKYKDLVIVALCESRMSLSYCIIICTIENNVTSADKVSETRFKPVEQE